MSVEVKTTGMIVVIFLVVIAVFSRQLDRDRLMQLAVALTAAFALVVVVLDIWVYRPLNSLIRRSRRRLGSRYENADPRHRDEIAELDHLINTIIRTFTEVESHEMRTASAESDLIRLQNFNRQLVEVGDIGQEINAALPYRETVERTLARAKTFLRADFVALISLEPNTRAFDVVGALGVQAPSIDADCCLFTTDCPVRKAIDDRAIVRSADHTCTLFPQTMKSQLIVPFEVEPMGEMALLATSTTSEHFDEVATNVLSTLQGHVHGALSNARKYDSIRRQVVTDHLTRLYNRRFFMNRAEEELSRSLRNQQPLSLVILDIDHFKHFNDSYGHATGDRVLQVVAAVMQQHVRKSDICSRHGGEEFGMLLPNTPGDNASFMANRLRRTLGETRYTGLGLPSDVNITISMGVATCPRDATTVAELFELADKALYKAKADGRDRVIQYGVEVQPAFYD
ncbi:MAG TPA: GGDEF domain-containing protein [Thermoleophilia bacterium]|nr:GGDEF domain-containing protein [Thermoleophilia bacterium]